MPKGEKSASIAVLKRQANPIKKGSRSNGTSKAKAAKRAGSTVNKMTGGGKNGSSGRRKTLMKTPSRKGGWTKKKA